MSAKYTYTVRECGRGPVVGGLIAVSAETANLLLLAPDKPLAKLAVGEYTIGRARGGEAYEIVRVA